MKTSGTVNCLAPFGWKMNIAGVTFPYQGIHFLQLFRQRAVWKHSEFVLIASFISLFKDKHAAFTNVLLDCIALCAVKGVFQSFALHSL